MAIPWLIGAALVGAIGVVAAVVSDSDSSSSSSDDEERAKRRSEADRKEKENEQVVLQKIAMLEQAVDLLMKSYGIDEVEALRFLNPDEDVTYLPDELSQKLESIKGEIENIKKALIFLEEIEDEL